MPQKTDKAKNKRTSNLSIWVQVERILVEVKEIKYTLSFLLIVIILLIKGCSISFGISKCSNEFYWNYSFSSPTIFDNVIEKIVENTLHDSEKVK